MRNVLIKSDVPQGAVLGPILIVPACTRSEDELSVLSHFCVGSYSCSGKTTWHSICGNIIYITVIDNMS